jgi:CBS domain-containing membrane protein
MTAADVMTRDVVTAGPDASPTTLAALFARHRIKTIPIVGKGQRVIGIVTQSDMMRRALDACRAAEILTTPARTVAPEAGAAVLMDILADDSVGAAPVVERGVLAGIVTRMDVVALLARGAPALSGDASPESGGDRSRLKR